MSRPRVTVLLPVYNGGMYIDEAVRSILRQTFPDFELLAIDDGSTDGTLEALRAYRDPRVRIVVNDRNLGLVDTLNRGLSLSRGEYVARMDSDDVSLPGRLERQVRFLDGNPEVGVCGTWARIIRGHRNGPLICPPVDPEEIRSRLLFGSAMVHPSVMIRLSKLADHDLRYDPRHAHAEDFGMWGRCSEHFPLANIPRVLIAYRVTQSSCQFQSLTSAGGECERDLPGSFKASGVGTVRGGPGSASPDRPVLFLRGPGSGGPCGEVASHLAGGKRQPADISRAGVFEGSRGAVVRHLRRDGAFREIGVEVIPALTAASPGGSGRIACGKIRREVRYRADCYAVAPWGSAVTAWTAKNVVHFAAPSRNWLIATGRARLNERGPLYWA